MRPPVFRQQVKKPEFLGPEHIPAFWNPNRASSREAPKEFTAKLRDISEDLAITWNPIIERWQVFAKAPSFQTKICSGWRLLFIHHLNGQYLPLDERLLARIYAIDAQRMGNGRQYFDRIVAEMERDREKREKQDLQDSIDLAMPTWEYSQIKNIGKGSKFSTYHQ